MLSCPARQLEAEFTIQVAAALYAAPAAHSSGLTPSGHSIADVSQPTGARALVAHLVGPCAASPKAIRSRPWVPGLPRGVPAAADNLAGAEATVTATMTATEGASALVPAMMGTCASCRGSEPVEEVGNTGKRTMPKVVTAAFAEAGVEVLGTATSGLSVRNSRTRRWHRGRLASMLATAGG